MSRSSASDSSNTAARCPVGTGNSARSAACAGCKPNTGSTRAGARPASEASCLATSTGCRPGSTEIPLPAFSRRVRDSANAKPVNGSTSGEYTFSGSHSESTPACSSRSTAAANWSAAPADPRDTPIRTFMAPSDHSAGPSSSGRVPIQGIPDHEKAASGTARDGSGTAGTSAGRTDERIGAWDGRVAPGPTPRTRHPGGREWNHQRRKAVTIMPYRRITLVEVTRRKSSSAAAHGL